jgi:multidrug efflux system membrane fusion protein
MFGMKHRMSTLADSPSSARPPLPRRRRWPLTLALFALACAALVAATHFWRHRGAAHDAGAAPPASSAARVVSVLTAKATQEDVPVWLEGLGTVTAYFRVTVKPQVDGRLVSVSFTEGHSVKKGELLAQIDPRPFAIQLESARAALARDQANRKNAEATVLRDEALAKDSLIPAQQLADQRSTAAQLAAQVSADQAQIDAARLNLEYARITSPIDGVAGVRQVDPGNVVRQTDPNGLVVVTQIDPIAVFFTLPEDQLPAVRDAMSQGTLEVEAFSRDGARSLGTGELAMIDNEINQATATVRLKAIFKNADHRLWPNQFVKARLKLTTHSNALVVPTTAVQHGPNGTFVYVVSADGTAGLRTVKVSSTEGERAILASGVAAGDAVVVSGQAQLRPGAKVSSKTGP